MAVPSRRLAMPFHVHTSMLWARTYCFACVIWFLISYACTYICMILFIFVTSYSCLVKHAHAISYMWYHSYLFYIYARYLNTIDKHYLLFLFEQIKCGTWRNEWWNEIYTVRISCLVWTYPLICTKNYSFVLSGTSSGHIKTNTHGSNTVHLWDT